MPLLSVRGLALRFGGIVALDGVDLDVEAGQICGVIGPNGAGKTTLFNCISRLVDWRSGRIVFDGHALAALPAHRLAALGMARTFQNLALFDSLSVRDNLLVGAHSQAHSGFIAAALRLPRVAAEEARLRDHAETLIDLLGLGAVADRAAGSLSFAERKRVELARALAGRPRLLLLDEPAAALGHAERDALARQIVNLRDRLQLTVLLVEHHMPWVMAVCDHLVALNFGRKIAEGPPAQVRAHADVRAAYLGGGLMNDER